MAIVANDWQPPGEIAIDRAMATKDRITTINVSLPSSQRRFVEADVARKGYASLSEYFRELIRERQRRTAGGDAADDREAARAAVRSIVELQKKLSLKGVSIEELIGEGRDP